MMIDLQKISIKRWGGRYHLQSDGPERDRVLRDQVAWRKVSQDLPADAFTSSSHIYIAHPNRFNGSRWIMSGSCLFVLGIILIAFFGFQKSHVSLPGSDPATEHYGHAVLSGNNRNIVLESQGELNATWKTPFHATLAVSDTVWIRAIVDNTLLFEGLLYRGMTEKWSCHESFVLKIADPSRVILSNENDVFLFPRHILKTQRPVVVSFQSTRNPLIALD